MNIRETVSRLFSGPAARSASTAVATRAAPGRSMFGGRFMPSPYDANSRHPAMPAVPVIGPEGSIPYLREQQALARHMLRNHAWIRSTFLVIKKSVVGRGPSPISKHRALEVLWAAASPTMDHTGRHSFGAWLREDVYGNKLVDGEVFVRPRLRFDYPNQSRRLAVPIRFQALQSAYCPVEHDHFHSDDGKSRFVAGVGTYLDEPVFYALHAQHPQSRNFRRLPPLRIPASEVFHAFESETGNPRGEVILASAFLRAIAMSTIEDAEIRRKQIASIMTVFFKRTADSAEALQGKDALPNSEVIGDMLRNVTFGSGLAHELPPGFEVETVQPDDEPENFEKALRWQILAICASLGAPVYEVTGDYGSITERAMKFASGSVNRTIELERDNLEHQVLDPMWCVFVDAAVASGRFIPPADATLEDLYAVDWSWPVVAQAALSQELNTIMKVVEAGHLPPSYIPEAYFGMRHVDVVRQSAKDHARLRENGMLVGNERWDPTQTATATSIMSEAEAEEAAEREVVDASALLNG